MNPDKIIQTSRHRTDLGDIAGLADSIAHVGLLHPIVITPERELVAGRRRLAAVHSLGWDDVPVHIVDNLTDAAAMLRAESDENTCRKPLTPTEAFSLASAREAVLEPVREAARREKIRQAQFSDKSSDGAKFAPSEPEPKTRETAALGTGYSHEGLRKVGEVEKIANDPAQPEPVRAEAAQALADMDQTGKIDPAYKKAKAAESLQHVETVEERHAREHKEALTHVYSRMAEALQRLRGYGGYPDMDDVMKDYSTEYLRPASFESEFDAESLRQVHRFVEYLIKWQESQK